MGKNVNTIPSTDNMNYSIRWISFQSLQNSIDAQIPKMGKAGKSLNISKAEPTYIIMENDVWNRCVKVDQNKIKKLKGAEITNEAEKKRLKKKRDRKYYQEKNSHNSYTR